MTIHESQYDRIKSILSEMSSGDPSSQFLDFGGVNKNLSPKLVKVILKFKTFSVRMLPANRGKNFCFMVEEYSLTVKGMAREDTLKALDLIYAGTKKVNTLQSIASSAIGTKQ